MASRTDDPVGEALRGHAAFAPLRIEALYASYLETLIAQLRARFGSGPPEPEDMAQRAFIQLIRRGDYASIRDPKAYLFRAATNAALSELRAISVRAHHAGQVRQQHQVQSPERPGALPDQLVSSRQLLARAMQVIEGLPAKPRRIFRQRRFEDLSISEIARREGISRAAVRKHLARATAAVDKMLADCPL
ncbi:MAG: sigma-70 family RNA polymerase sigma factor [Pseudomonadota bacterium]